MKPLLIKLNEVLKDICKEYDINSYEHLIGVLEIWKHDKIEEMRNEK